MPMLLCVGAINTFLIQKKLRGYVSINVQSGEAIDTHSFATLIGVGATTVNPYLAFDSLYQRYEKKLFGQFSFDECVQRYINSVNAGLLKIMSKMGISVLSSYRGGCNFETVGLSRTVVDDYFPGVTSKISGIGLVGIEKKIREIHKEAFDRIVGTIQKIKNGEKAKIIIGGNYDDTKGFFVEPTVVLTEDHQYETMTKELFGPLVTIYCYDDENWIQTLKVIDQTSEYALTGAILSIDRNAIEKATKKLGLLMTL